MYLKKTTQRSRMARNAFKMSVVFPANPFIIKTHYLSGPKLECQRGPGDTENRKMKYELMSETTANDEKKKPGPGGSGKPGTARKFRKQMKKQSRHAKIPHRTWSNA